MDKTFGLGAGRSGVRIPGRGKCSLITTAVDARVNYPLYLTAERRDEWYWCVPLPVGRPRFRVSGTVRPILIRF